MGMMKIHVSNDFSTAHRARITVSESEGHRAWSQDAACTTEQSAPQHNDSLPSLQKDAENGNDAEDANRAKRSQAAGSAIF